MKKLALAMAATLVATGPLFAGTAIEKHAKPAMSSTRVAQPETPLLDLLKTFSIGPKKATSRPDARKPSGIEVNPFIVPTFM